MKNITLLLSIMLCVFYQAHAQGLIVSYEETRTVQPPNLSYIDNPQIRAAAESNIRNLSQTKQATLLVNNGVSLYTVGASKDVQRRQEMAEGNTSGNISTTLKTITPHLYYKNHLDGIMLSQVNVDGKEYLVEGPLTERKWKIGKKKKNISGYECIEATYKSSNGTAVIAWYTPDIPISDGPSSYQGLPGLILYVDMNNGSLVYACTSIEPNNDLAAIEAPVTGEKMTKEQYEKMTNERVQEILQKGAPTEERTDNSVRRTGSYVIK